MQKFRMDTDEQQRRSLQAYIFDLEDIKDKTEEQSRLLEAFFEHSLTPFAILDKNFNFIRVNEAFARACQRSISEFRGHNHFDFYPSDAEEIFRQVVEIKIAYRAIARPFVYRDHPEWGVTYWDWTLVPILDKYGEIDFLIFSLNDVTKRKLAEEEVQKQATELKRKEKELRDSPLYARNLIEASMDPLVTISADGKIMDVNSATEMITGLDRDRLIGTAFSGYFTEPEKAREVYNVAFSKGCIRDYPLSIRNACGQTKELLFNAAFYKNEAGEVQGILADATDITELKRAQETLKKAQSELELRVAERTNELRIANEALQNEITERKQAEYLIEQRTRLLESANKELESFSYSVSHDLRAPLRAIDGFARMILKKQGTKFDEETLSRFNVIRSNAHKMGELIDELLAFSRLGKKHMAMSKLDMGDLIRDVWKELQVINTDRNMVLTIHNMPPGYGDMILIKQVYFNLLSNAVKFTTYRDIARIEAGGYADENENVYYVRDNGAGFDMTYYDKLFCVFQRLHSDVDFDGTGVGLATVQRIINRHGGRVWAEGTTDKGASFYFTLGRNE